MGREWKGRMGSSFTSHQDEIILHIGRDTFSRQQMIDDLHCGNFPAAARLNVALRGYHPASIKELARRIKIDNLFGVKGVGVTTAYVWLCALESAEIDPLKWLGKGPKIPTIYSWKKNRLGRPRRKGRRR